MMRKLRQHFVWVLLLLIAAVCSIVAPHATAQQVNASVNSSSGESSVGSGANVSAAVKANEGASISGSISSSGSMSPGGSSGTAGSAQGLSSFGPGSAFNSSVKSFAGPANLPVAEQLRIAASQHRSGSLHAGAKPLSKQSVSMSGTELQSDTESHSAQANDRTEYAVFGQFPDSTRGTGWPTPYAFYVPYRIGFSVHMLTWEPDFNSVEHLKLSYLVSFAVANYLRSVRKIGRNAPGRPTKLQSLTDILKNENKNKSLEPDLLMNPLGSNDGSDVPDQLK